MSEHTFTCPQCQSPYGYPLSEQLFTCPECGHEWDPTVVTAQEGLQVLDANGNPLQDGDAVVVIKNLPVKGAP